MTIPSYEKIMVPLLIFSKDRKEHSNEESLQHIIRAFTLTLKKAKFV